MEERATLFVQREPATKQHDTRGEEYATRGGGIRRRGKDRLLSRRSKEEEEEEGRCAAPHTTEKRRSRWAFVCRGCNGRAGDVVSVEDLLPALLSQDGVDVPLPAVPLCVGREAEQKLLAPSDL